jgi:hypothetical protein
MCFDSKRGVTVYSGENGTYAYDAAKDSWSKIGAGRPKAMYCDMAYDAAADLYVVNTSNRGGRGIETEACFTLKPAGGGEPVAGRVAPREKVDDAPFPPPADPAALARIRSMPANTWIEAKPKIEPTPRSWSTMCWDPWLRCVIYQGGGHRGTMDNTVSAYFPEANAWVNAFKSQWPTKIQGNVGSIPNNLSFERGVEGSDHDRWYESIGGIMIGTARSGFDWATREKHMQSSVPWFSKRLPFNDGTAGFVVHPLRPEVISFSGGTYAGKAGESIQVYNLETGKSKTHNTSGPVPFIPCEWSGLAVHPDKDLLVLHGAADGKNRAGGTQTWTLDLKNPTAWKKLELKSTTPPSGPAKLCAVPGTDYCVLATPGSKDLWVLDLARNAWKPLPVTNPKDFLKKGRKRPQRFALYGWCVWDPHHKVIITVKAGTAKVKNGTVLLKPDFSKINWARPGE